MSELIESDQERNGGDVEEGYKSEGEADSEGEEEEKSFLDSEEEREIVSKAKKNQVKINNSFTGPYPLDPIDFPHTDKGPNQQFVQLDALWMIISSHA